MLHKKSKSKVVGIWMIIITCLFCVEVSYAAGSGFFPIVMWLEGAPGIMGYDQNTATSFFNACFSGIAAMNCNTVRPTNVPLEYVHKLMESAAANNLKVILDPGWGHNLINMTTTDILNNWEAIKAAIKSDVIDEFSGYENLLGYAVDDEPPIEKIAQWKLAVKMFNELDPDHPDYTVFNKPDVLDNVINDSSVPISAIIYDNYPFEINVPYYIMGPPTKPDYQWFNRYKAFNEACQPRYLVPQISLLQAFEGGECPWRYPKPEELRTCVYTSLAAGARGIAFFMYMDSYTLSGLVNVNHVPHDQALFNAVKTLAGELRQSGSILVDLHSTTGGVISGWNTEATALIGSYANASGEKYYIVANKDPDPGHANITETIQLPDSSYLLTDIYSGVTFPANSSGIASIPLAPAAGRVLKVGTSGGDLEPPFGSFDTPTSGSTVSGSIAVTGWALDDVGVESVKIYRETGIDKGAYIGDAVFVAGARPDVEQLYPGYPNCNRAGWGYMLLTHFLPDGGNGSFTFTAYARDSASREVKLGSKVVTVDNANAVKPFGAIDTPAQGGTASGSNYVVWGWALTPQPNEIPEDGSTISVWVDGIMAGRPTYNIYREDIATLFPDYANSNGAVGYFYLDTMNYTNGIHTIHWIATDDAGNSDGIGSRYFSIYNSENQSTASLTGPMPGTKLSNSTETFGWSDGSGVSAYKIDVGTSLGSNNIHDGSSSTLHWQEVSNLPTNGETIYVRLSSQIDGVWINNDYAYDAAGSPVVYQPEISLDKTAITRSLQQGWSLSSDTFQVRNSGIGTLEYAISDNRSWLSVSPTGGTSTGEWDTISVNYSTGSLEVGTYTAVITVSAPNIAAKTLSITVNVNDPDSLFTFADIGEMTGGDPRTRIWGCRGITNSDIPGGPVAVGRGSDGGEGNGFTAFRWQNGTFVGLPRTGVTPYTSNSWGYGISADGSVVYGGDLDNAAANQAVVWTNTGSGWASANKIVLSGSSGWGALSANGQVIVDYSDNVAYKFTTSDNWATSGGVSRATLTGMTTARGCSADGSIIVGTDASGPAIFNGPGGPAKTVSLPGPGTCLAVSDDGTVAAGTSPTNIYGKDEPCQWVYSDGIWEKTILPLLPGMVPEYRKPTGYALAVSADGRRIAGHFREYGDYYIPLVWENGGVQKLEDMLNSAGIFLDSGWYLADLGAMSPDGKTFGGSMSDQPIGTADNNRHAWIATIEGAAGSDIFDSGFETDTGWTFDVPGSFPGTSVYRSNWGIANEHSGSYALAISNQAYARADTGFIAAGPGSHTISAWMRGEMDDSSFGGWILQAFFYDSNKHALSTVWLDACKCLGQDTCLTTTWTEKSGTVDAPAGTAYLKIRLRIYMVGGWIAFDDVALDGNPLTVAAHGVDGGFETDTGWTYGTHSSFPGSSVYRSNWGIANEHSGSYALAMSNQAYARADTDFVAAGPGSHTISAWVRGEMSASSFGGWILQAFFYDSNKHALSTVWLDARKCLGQDTCLSTTWAEMSGAVDAPAGTAYLKIRLRIYMVGGWIAFDDVALDGNPLTVAAHGVDGGFETATGWTYGTHSSFPCSSVFRATWGTANEHSGSCALAMSNQAYAQPVTDFIAAGPGLYTISAWLRGEMDDSSYCGWLIRAFFYDNNKQALSPAWQNVSNCFGGVDCLSTTWSEKSGIVEAPAGTAYIKLRLYFHMAGGWAAYDDVKIEKAN